MTQKNQVYKCLVCGNIVEVLHAGAGKLVCCSQDMQLQIEKDSEEGLTEKHKPIINNDQIMVGSKEHPMEENHYIEWIEVISEKECIRKELVAGDKPIVNLKTKESRNIRAYCNIHGLWKN